MTYRAIDEWVCDGCERVEARDARENGGLLPAKWTHISVITPEGRSLASHACEECTGKVVARLTNWKTLL